MANQTVTVLEADGVTSTDVEVLGFGRQAAAASKSTAMSTEDKAVLDAIAASLATIDNSIAGSETQVDVVTVPTDPFGANADAASATGSVSAKLRGIATALGVTALDLGSGTGGTRTIRTMIDSSQLDPTVAHDAVDSGAPYKMGMRAIAHGTNPTAVAAADRTDWLASRAGIPWVIGGHPNVVTRSATIDDADGAQTDASLLTVAGGSKIVVTAISAIASASNSGSVAVRIGFGAATLPAASEAGAAGILLEGKYSAGNGNQKGNGAGILGIGADGEDLRITCDDPAGGSLFVTFSYYTIES